VPRTALSVRRAQRRRLPRCTASGRTLVEPSPDVGRSNPVGLWAGVPQLAGRLSTFVRRWQCWSGLPVSPARPQPVPG
jgi:hypothetical protein